MLGALFRRFALTLLIALTLAVGGAWAQDGAADTALDNAAYQEWNKLAARAQEVIERGLASSAALEVLRADVVDWRTLFREGQTEHAARVTTLRDQIAALGPKPEDGTPEPEQIAEKRAELEARLLEAEAPGRRATAAFEEASGIIREIDAIIQARETGALYDTSPAAINPENWWPSLAALGAFSTALWLEFSEPFGSTAGRALVIDRVPVILVSLLLGFVLLLRARRWLTRLYRGLAIRFSRNEPARRVAQLVLVTAHVLLQTVGLVALGVALEQTGVQGLRAMELINSIAAMGFLFLISRALGNLFFGESPLASTFLDLPVETRAQGRWISMGLGAMVALSVLVDIWIGMGDAVATYWSVLAFPVVLTTGLLLMRLSKMLNATATAALEHSEEATVMPRILKLLSRAILVVAVVAPALSLFGYADAAQALIWPMVMSIGMLAVIVLVQGLVYDLRSLMLRLETTNYDALLPTLVGFALFLGALPLFALIWGVRPARLAELWGAFMDGVSFGGVVISPTSFLAFAIVFAALYIATRLLQGVLRSTVLPKTNLDSGGKEAIVAGTGYVGVFLSALVAITTAGIDLSGLAIVAGALSVGIGFGLQTIVSNFVSGVILLIERPIKIGDWISVGGTMGTVRAISVRSTRIETFDRQDVIVPNADLIAQSVVNYTLSSTTGRLIVPVGVAYGTDSRRVEKILLEIAESHPMVLSYPAPSVVFQGFGADSLDFEIRVILRDVNTMVSVKSEMNHTILERFTAEGIEIPYAQRDIWIRNPEVLLPKEAT